MILIRKERLCLVPETSSLLCGHLLPFPEPEFSAEYSGLGRGLGQVDASYLKPLEVCFV